MMLVLELIGKDLWRVGAYILPSGTWWQAEGGREGCLLIEAVGAQREHGEELQARS